MEVKKSDPSDSKHERSRSRSRERTDDQRGDNDPDRKRHKHHRHHHHRHHSRDNDEERHDRHRHHHHRSTRESRNNDEEDDDEKRRERRSEDKRVDERDRNKEEEDYKRRERREREKDLHRDRDDQRERHDRRIDEGPLMPSQHAIPPRLVVPSVTTAALTATVIEPLAPGYGQGSYSSKSASFNSTKSASAATAATGDDKIAKLFGYTADVNPFGDPNLTSQFVWKRKVEKDLATGKISREPTAEDLARQRDEMMTEILRAKERRLRAEAEEEERERLRSEEARLRNSSEYAEWDQKEEDFHMRQIRDRCLIRIKDKREHPVDAIAKNCVVMSACSAGRDDDEEFLRLEVQIKSPLTILRGFAKSAMFSSTPAHHHHHHHSSSSSSYSSRQQQSGPAYALSQLEQLKAEINEFIALEKGVGSFADYFKHCLIVCEDEERRIRSLTRGIESGQSAANIEAVEAEIEAMFIGKNDLQLGELEKDVRNLLEQSRVRGNAVVGNALHFRQIQVPTTGAGGREGGAGGAIDSDYWDSVLKSLLAARSRSAIKKMHEEQLLARLEQMEKRSEMRKRALLNKTQNKIMGLPTKAPAPVVVIKEEKNIVKDKEEKVKNEEYGLSTHNPSSGGLNDDDNDEDEEYGAHKVPQTAGLVTGAAAIVDIAADARAVSIQKRIAELQAQGMIMNANKNDNEEDDNDDRSRAREGGDGADDADVAAFIDETGRALPTGFFETSLDASAEVGLQSFTSSHGGSNAGNSLSSSSSVTSAELLEKYRPRKPRFFNRVKSGYDWNRYNSAHYNRDNPPPKTVQGYKFTIFYPDLIDKSKTPSFKLEPAASQEFVIIRFKAGPPYEDIAFQIVNKEWDTGRMSGYRCVYDRGILQLFFNFKRARYRK